MATKRIAGTAINWAALSERVPPQQRAQFQAFKTRSDQYLRRYLIKAASLYYITALFLGYCKILKKPQQLTGPFTNLAFPLLEW